MNPEHEMTAAEALALAHEKWGKRGNVTVSENLTKYDDHNSRLLTIGIHVGDRFDGGGYASFVYLPSYASSEPATWEKAFAIAEAAAPAIIDNLEIEAEMKRRRRQARQQPAKGESAGDDGIGNA